MLIVTSEVTDMEKLISSNPPTFYQPRRKKKNKKGSVNCSVVWDSLGPHGL